MYLVSIVLLVSILFNQVVCDNFGEGFAVTEQLRNTGLEKYFLSNIVARCCESKKNFLRHFLKIKVGLNKIIILCNMVIHSNAASTCSSVKRTLLEFQRGDKRGTYDFLINATAISYHIPRRLRFLQVYIKTKDV